MTFALRRALTLLAAHAALAPLAASAQPAAPAPTAPDIATSSALSMAAGDRRIELTAIADGVVRIRMARQGGPLPEDASWAVGRALRQARVAARIEGNVLETAAMRITVDPATLAIRTTDPAGRVILADDAEALRIEGKGFALRKRMGIGEHIFALGDKTGVLDRRGRSFVNWNTDAFGYKAGEDPIYKSIPFYISSGGPGGAYGLLLDNSWRAWFDFGHREADVLAFGADDGPIDYYLIAGPAMPEVVRRYTALTGRAPLPPRWALGYQQSRWSYETEQEVRELAARLRKERVPTDVIWLDIDYQDRNRPFTINRQRFPDFPGMVRDMDAQGIKMVAITDLHIAHAPGEGYAPYDSGTAGDHFVRNPDGSTYVAPVWPGPSVFPDFTRKATRDWWGSLYGPLTAAGVAGIWNDMNEPAVFETPTKTMPTDVRDRIDSDDFAPRTTTQAEIHNVFGMQNSRATFDGLLKLRPDERPFVMTRASYAGGQRYAATWTGDNSSSWEHLKLSVAQTINLGLSGFTWTGADVGGFVGGATPELMTRWFQYATFAPIFRDHANKIAPRAEPWVDGPEHLAIRRRFVEERYRLLPYFYALADRSARSGDPLMRPLFYDYPEMLQAGCDATMSFTLGARLLIAGSPKPEAAVPYEACLPKGGWYDYWSGAAVSAPPSADGLSTALMLTPHIETLPVFVRAGTILPRQPLVQSTSHRPEGALELHVYPGPGCTGELYDDDGHSLAHQRGVFLRQSLSCTASDKGVTRLSFGKREGSWKPWWNAIRVTIHGGQPYRAALNGRALAVESAAGSASFTLPDQRGEASVELVPGG